LEKIIINTADQTSLVAIGEKWTNFVNYLPATRGVIITDDNILHLYGHQFPDLPVISVIPGEGSKSLKTVEEITGQLLELGLDRSGFLTGIGGGVVCDLTGFVASIYMRGIGFGFVSTSLLSQIDASVGGKNGVNTGQVKNVLGSFGQPGFVICDPVMLHTLPEEEFLSGLAEIIKMGAIMDPELLKEVELNRLSILKRDEGILNSLITRSVRLKAAVVAEDEKESGRRMILNFGHTYGHVIETVLSLKHGYAVSSGMVLAAAISVDEGILEIEDFKRLCRILNEFGLIGKHEIPAETLLKKLKGDKKKKGDEISFILIGPPGKATIRQIPVQKLVAYYETHSAVK
jgi:3-dehydroquinate synthase